MAIWVLKEGQREGPYEEQDLRELLYEGTYTDIDPAIRDGQLDWSTLGQLLGRDRAGTEAPPSEPSPVLPIPPPFPEIPGSPEPLSIESLPGAERPIPVAVVDFQMPFVSMVLFMVKWVMAAIAVMLILGVIALPFWVVCAKIIAALLRHL